MSARPTTNLRPDFPSAFTEWYFLSVLALTLCLYLTRAPSHPALLTLEWVLLIEANVWIFYYLLLRGFLETRYTIFHPAEYLLTFPIVLASVATLAALITGRPINELLVDAVGNPQKGDAVGVGVAVASLFYLGVAISVVLSSHPGIKTRSPQNLVIIGAGDVTINRTLPGLLALGYDRDDILVVTADEATQGDRATIERRAARLLVAPPDQVLRTSLRERSPTVIASPTAAHFGQVTQLADAGVPFAVEKPIVWSRAEREILRAQPSLMANGFALSYYSLEKALPLTYIMNPLPVYRRFLISEPASLIRSTELAAARETLGDLVSARVELLEGVSRSPRGQQRLWTELPGTLRPFVETTVHPLLVIRHVTGEAAPRWDSCVIGRYAPRAREILDATGQEIAPTWIEAHGTIGDARISMRVGKYVPDALTRRQASFEFTHGGITCDFDARTATVVVGGETLGTVGIGGGSLRTNYAVLMSMFIEFSLNGWGAVRFDDLPRQLDALDWWDDLCSRVEAVGVPCHSYENAPPDAPATPL
ncbi:Gfo/Idh/MocA family oxidoreductase [Catenuloplanes japonicus]|uniref:hypothetical protein n=1 Tax=Catenuloplanes japonicus TaxID=33876 RepID=UPI000524AA9A|nr:hypothetical protein [Catenuloplanes japonicus]